MKLNQLSFMRKVYLLVFICLILLAGCTSKIAEQTLEQYTQVFSKVQELEKLTTESYFKNASGVELYEMYNLGKELYYDYDPMDLKPEQKDACESLKVRINGLKNKIISQVESQISYFKITPYNEKDVLIENTRTLPVYLQKGEVLRCNISAEKPITVKICNADSRKVLKTFLGKSQVQDSMVVANSAIYLVQINPIGVQYIDYEINYKIKEMSRLASATLIKEEQSECSKGDFGAVSVPGVSLRKVYEEPKKFTLKGQFKAAFSGGGDIALVPVKVPAGATDILYSMRIATSESDKYSDGKFHDGLASTYKKVKFLGLPLYEKTKSGGSGLISTLLDDNRPLREEDAYCNMYVFRNQSQAKQFQDGTKMASELNYDVDWSTVGTQSCNGRIPVNGAKTIYLAFQNERVRYTNYLWVEVEAVVPQTEYYRTKYSIE